MKKLLAAAAAAATAIALAAPASAAITFNFQDGPAHSPQPGFDLINTFDTAAEQAQVTGSGFLFKVPPADGQGAPPANSDPSGTTYLSQTRNGVGATIMFDEAVSEFQFDWGSIDDYNILTIYTTTGSTVVIPGTTFTNAADGNQTAPGTNGLFTVSGAKFTGFTLTSGNNSFEIDNVAVNVPEPATWAMMIMGFGGVGAIIRRRKTLSVMQAA